MKRVLYLCLNNKFNNVGFVFPNELEENFYSPGFFIIQAEDKLVRMPRKFHNEYLFLAVEKGKIFKNTLKFIENNKFKVNTEKYGDILFEAIYVPSTINRYIGSRHNLISEGFNNMYALKCTNTELLERICKENDFYFVGSTDY